MLSDIERFQIAGAIIFFTVMALAVFCLFAEWFCGLPGLQKIWAALVYVAWYSAGFGLTIGFIKMDGGRETIWEKIIVPATFGALGLGMLIPCLYFLPGHISWYLKMSESRRIAKMASTVS